MAIVDTVLATITGLILAGGRGSRMAHQDKGLVPFLDGRSLVEHVLQRLQPQVASVCISANRNLLRYQALGLQVVTDAAVQNRAELHEFHGPDGPPSPRRAAAIDATTDVTKHIPPNTVFAGPLAGVLAGQRACTTPLLLTVPCDSPRLPLDLALRLATALHNAQADIAVAASPDHHTRLNADPGLRNQPVFCLMRREVQASLAAYLAGGGREMGHWQASQRQVVVPFNLPHDDTAAFANVNSYVELQALEWGLLGPASTGTGPAGRLLGTSETG